MMDPAPTLLTEIGLVVTRPSSSSAAATAVQKESDEAPTGISETDARGALIDDKTQVVVEEFLRVIDGLPDDPNLKKLRGKFTEMYNPERTDNSFLASAGFRNMLKLACGRCQDMPSKVKTHIREVIDNMVLNYPKSEEERAKISENKKRKLKPNRSSETVIERLYLTLESVLQKIRSVQVREESNEEDSRMESNYVYLGRLQKRAVDLYKHIQQLEGNRVTTLTETERPIIVRSTNYPEINRATAKMAKRCLKRGMTPDYCDVFTVVKRISEQDDLGMSEDRKRTVSLSVFKEIVDQIKSRRNKDTFRNFESLEIELANQSGEDPADNDEELRARLKENNIAGQAKIDSIINKYADKQTNGGNHHSSSEEPEDEASDNSDNENDDENSVLNDDIGDNDDTSRESNVDEKYLDTASSEENEDGEVDCDEIIKRYGQDRERPRVEPQVAEETEGPEIEANGTSFTKSTLKRQLDGEQGEPTSNVKKRSVEVIELTDSEEEEILSQALPSPPRRRVVPKRLMTLGTTPSPEHPPEAQNDNEYSQGQEVIEISD